MNSESVQLMQPSTDIMKQSLKALLIILFAIVVVGQWMFALYIFKQFGIDSLRGAPSEADYSHMIEGYVEGDAIGNAFLVLHIVPVILISLGGFLQFVPILRKRFPTLHKWNGRLFLLIGLSGALTGLYLTWIKGTRFSDFGAMGITINGLLIPIAIAFAWYYARKRRFDLHMRWAVHAFILINGVWTFRLYLMGWFMVNQGPYGNSSTIDGPADIFMSYACYLLPMLLAELYFWAKRKQSAMRLLVANLSTVFAIAITGIGVTAASLIMWWPRIAA